MNNILKVEKNECKIICGFPGIGKTYVANNITDYKTLDYDSATHKLNFKTPEDSSLDDREYFVKTYTEEILKHYNSLDENGNRIYNYIFISTHNDTLRELVKEEEPFTIIVPRREAKEEYRQRYIKRNSPESLINIIMDNWDKFIDDLENLEKEFPNLVTLVRLEEGRYLSEFLGFIHLATSNTERLYNLKLSDFVKEYHKYDNEEIKDLSKNELLNLIKEYDKYIYNDGEKWDKDRQPVCLSEFYHNEYQNN